MTVMWDVLRQVMRRIIVNKAVGGCVRVGREM